MEKKIFSVNPKNFSEREAKPSISKENSLNTLTNFSKIDPSESQGYTAPSGAKTFPSEISITSLIIEKTTKNCSFSPRERIGQKSSSLHQHTSFTLANNTDTMFGSFRQPKKSEKTRQASPYETRNAKKAKNIAEETSLA